MIWQAAEKVRPDGQWQKVGGKNARVFAICHLPSAICHLPSGCVFQHPASAE
jgi:hypothetical protein